MKKLVLLSAAAMLVASVGMRVGSAEEVEEEIEIGEGPHAQGRRPMPPHVEEFLQDLKKSDPQTFEELQKARKDGRKLLFHKLRRFGPMLGQPEFRPLVAKGLALEVKARRLKEDYRQAKDDKAREKLKTEIKGVLDQQFDLKLQGHELRLKHMEGQISGLKERIEKRRKLKEKIVAKRLSELTNEEESWDW